MLKHEMDIKLLKEEVKTLRNLLRCMAIELGKNVSKEVTVIETNELGDPAEAKEIEAAPCEAIVRCEKCEFYLR